MKFRKLVIENYKSFQFPTEIVFPEGENGRSIFLIGGMNGAGKTSIMEAVTYCLYGAKVDEIFRNINRREKAKGNANVTFELVMEMDDGSQLIVKRSWTAGAASDPRPRDLSERLVVVRDGKRVSVQSQEIWQDFIRATIPPSITQFFFFDGEKIQEIAADDHSEVRLKSSLEAALGIQYINRLATDIAYIKQEERKGFVAISDEDLEFKQSELKRERSKLQRKRKDREDLQSELERRIFRLLKEGEPGTDQDKMLDLSDRDAARVLNRMETLESSDIFLLKPLLDEARGLEAQLRQLEGLGPGGGLTPSESALFDELQAEMEGCSTQIGRKSEQLRLLEEEILRLEKRIGEIEVEIEKLYEKHNVSKEKADFIEECDAIASVLNQFVVRLRKSKVHMLQEKTFEMYRLLSSRSGLIKDIVIDDKTYEVRITDRNGHEIRKSAMSAGEKEVFAVSLLWGLAQTSELKLPIIVDTPLSRLDSTHRDNIVNNYFPNAGEQVVILSTDTEIDTDYYRALKPRLSGAAILEFDQRQELTTFRSGYFWEGNHG